MTASGGQPTQDCWNRVGVRGDRSCEKLAEHAHCRHCEVHATSAQTMMQRELPHGYRQEWAAFFARQEDEQEAADRSALVFRIGGEWLALPAGLTVTIADPAAPHALPRRSGGVLAGIVNVKGRLYPCMALATLMSIDTEQPRAGQRRAFPRLVVVTLANQSFAFHVDDVHGIHRYASSSLLPVPTTANKGMHRFLAGVLAIGEMRVGCLDHDLVGFNLASALK